MSNLSLTQLRNGGIDGLMEIIPSLRTTLFESAETYIQPLVQPNSFVGE